MNECNEWKSVNSENLELLERYKVNCIGDAPTVPKFSQEISISLHVKEMVFKADDDSGDSAIFMFQCIAVCEFKMNLFYDGGCTDKKGARHFDKIESFDTCSRWANSSKRCWRHQICLPVWQIPNLDTVT